MNYKPHILFSVPTAHSITAETTFGIAQISAHPAVTYMQTKGAPTDWVRDNLALACLRGNYTHLMMMDSDIIPPDNIVEMLLELDTAMAAAIVPIIMDGQIVGNVVANQDHQDPAAFVPDAFFREWDRPAGAFKLSRAGAGCVLIQRHVFERVPWRWFHYDETPEGERQGEDFYFCQKAAQYGFRFMTSSHIRCGHLKQVDLLSMVNHGNFSSRTDDSDRS